MNSTVISGTPRQNSMKITREHLDDRHLERRPSASRMPSGKDTTIPTPPQPASPAARPIAPSRRRFEPELTGQQDEGEDGEDRTSR
jgi:hypothetical protein